MIQKPGCVFCEIAAKRSPATFQYEDDQIMVINNLLDWAPVMLLVMPKSHMTQTELWNNGSIGRIGSIAVQMGERFCPDGYRLLSNLGNDGMQSQEHGHLHVLGGKFLGRYV